MLFKYLTIITLTFTFSAYSQKQNNIWCFGDSTGIDFNNLISPTPFSSSLDTRGSCVSIADTNGQLLFYANTVAASGVNTTKVWDRNNFPMVNGDGIIGEGWYNELLILPFPNDEKKYYLFSLGVLGPYGLYYSVIDISLNGGLGKVIQKNVQLQTYQAWDAMAAIRHANGRDWWLITKDYDNSLGNKTFHVNLVTPYGIHDSVQSIGGIEYGGLGNMSFSKDGNRFLFTSYNGLIEVMDFDRCNGQFSNPLVILNANNFPHISGSAFSPNGNLVYISTSNGNSYLVQFDLLTLSRDTISTIINPFEAGGGLRLAPNDKIYWACAWTNGINFNYPYQDTMYHTENMNLSVINDPDVVGTGCNFSLYSFNLGGKRTYWGLPNNPDYSLGPVAGSACDSLFNSVGQISEREFALTIYPNPFEERISLFTENTNNKIEISIINKLGQQVYHGLLRSNTHEINLSFLTPGAYVLICKTSLGEIHRQIVKLK